MTTNTLSKIAAAVAAFAVIAATAPAFAWGSGAPDNYYGQAAQGSARYYDYAPEALAKQPARVAHERKHEAR